MFKYRSLKSITITLVVLNIALISDSYSQFSDKSPESLNRQAQEHITLGNYLDGYKFANLAREQSIFSNNQVELANALKLIGSSFYYLSDYNSALNYYQQSYLIYEQLNDVSNQARLLSHQANIYSDLNDYSLALELEETALNLFENHPAEKPLYKGLLLNYAYDLGKSGAYLESLEAYKKTKSLILESDELMAYYTIQLAEIHRTHNQLAKASTMIDSAIERTRDLFEPLYYDALLEKAKIELANKNYSTSVSFSETTVKFFKDHRRLSKLADSYDVLSKAYEKLKNLAKSLHYLKEKHRILDETQDIRTQLYAEAIAIERQLSANRKRMDEIRQQQQQRERQYLSRISQLQWALAIISLAFLISLTFIIRCIKRNSNQ